MSYFSQGDEERYILDFFKNENVGNVLDIGAYNAEIFSNSRKLILNGWSAVLVEPSKMCFDALYNFYKDVPNVEVVNYAIGNTVGYIDFYDSAGAVATGSEMHYNKWKDIQLDFKKTRVSCIMFQDLYSMFPYKFDFISIDTEGMDYEIIQQIDFDLTGTSLVCVEYTYNPVEIFKYLKGYGFSFIWNNGENLIMGRNIN